MDNIAEKIRKLLAKAESNNEHEASAALLKARALMAKYKIDEQAVKDAAPRQNVLNKLKYEEDSFSSVRNTYFYKLAKVIADNHCCGAYMNYTQGRKSRWMVFAGLDDDPAVAREIFSYAVQHIQAQAKEYGRYIRESGIYPMDETKKRAAAWLDSYADGFSRGLAAKYAEQFKQDDETGECKEMALALVQPQEVKDLFKTLHRTHMYTRNNGENDNAARAGYTAGYTFNPVKQIDAGA